jgi:hypothetical protein
VKRKKNAFSPGGGGGGEERFPYPSSIILLLLLPAVFVDMNTVLSILYDHPTKFVLFPVIHCILLPNYLYHYEEKAPILVLSFLWSIILPRYGIYAIFDLYGCGCLIVAYSFVVYLRALDEDNLKWDAFSVRMSIYRSDPRLKEIRALLPTSAIENCMTQEQLVAMMIIAKAKRDLQRDYLL